MQLLFLDFVGVTSCFSLFEVACFGHEVVDLVAAAAAWHHYTAIIMQLEVSRKLISQY